MDQRQIFGYGTKFLVIASALTIIFAGLYAAQSLLAPFFLAVFFAVVLMPPLRWLKSKGLSNWVAILVLSTIVFLFGLFVVAILSSSLNSFVNRLPTYQTKIGVVIKNADNWIDGVKKRFAEMEGSLKESVPVILSKTTTVEEPVEESAEEPKEKSVEPPSINPLPDKPSNDSSPPISSAEVRGDSTMSYLSLNKLVDLNTLTIYVRMLVQEMLNIASISFLIAVMVVFMMIEAAKLPEKIAAAFPDRDLSNEYLQRIGEDTWKYTKIKTVVSLLTGIATTVGLWFLGVEYPVLWGLLIFFLNFIPNIGPIIASVPPILLALVDQGLTGCCLVTGYLVLVNWVFGYGVEPRYLGEGLGISELVVLLSLIFWGWLLGPIGMFLSAPLTMVLKIVLQNNPETRWIAILMSNR